MNGEIGSEELGEGAPSSAVMSGRRVFVSYYQQSGEHREQVLRFTNQLREGGIDAWVDLYVESPSEGWPRWVERQLASAEFILLICTPEYCRHYLHASGGISARRISWEGQLIRQMLHDASGRYDLFVPVLLDEAHADVPPPLGSVTAYSIPSGYEALYRRLTHQPEIATPMLGPVIHLKPAAPRPRLSEGAPEELPWRARLDLLGRGLWRSARIHRWTVGGVLMLLFLIASLLWLGWIRLSPEGISAGPPTRLERCLQSARAIQRPYAIESVVIIWSLTDTSDRRRLSVRTVYTLRALRSFSAGDAGLFKEQYGHDKATFIHWYGPEEERFQSTEGRAYTIEFDGQQGEQRTVVTGAELEYVLPLPPDRPGFGNRVRLKSNEEFWRYPNDQDVICELTMIIQSDTTPITPVGIGGAFARGSEVTPKAAASRMTGETRQHSLSARWDQTLLPGDEVGIHFTW